jgi:nicotinate phosphoribosyltransferase
MGRMMLTEDETRWLNTIPFIRPTYTEWLKGYGFNPDEVRITQEDGSLKLTICGPWYRTILFEVPLMSIISELYFLLTNQSKSSDWKQRIENTGLNLSTHGCYWIDFGSRRRYSLEVQDAVVKSMRTMHGFLGTSNPHLAHKYNVTPQGTLAHEYIMGLSAFYGVRMANIKAMHHWASHFGGNLGVMLSDTFSTDVFLRDFDMYSAKLFDGVRQDSGDPIEWGNKMLAHYKKLNILTSNKRFVFSDNLNDEKYIRIHNTFKSVCQPIGGIGTFLTNNVGEHIIPLNMVIKMKRIKRTPSSEWIDVVKLSDSPSKYTGNPDVIRRI